MSSEYKEGLESSPKRIQNSVQRYVPFRLPCRLMQSRNNSCKQHHVGLRCRGRRGIESAN